LAEADPIPTSAVLTELGGLTGSRNSMQMFGNHWLNIDAERMERYETMLRWNPATEHFYAAAMIGEGHQIADFGCGPGHAAIEFAKWVGPRGHVHALDINEEFVRRTRIRADQQAIGTRITTHLLQDWRLPLDALSLDRVVARNTVIYTADPVTTFGEFRRVLRPGGIAHVIEGDWRLTAVEPVQTVEWQALIEAASWAWSRPEIGRQLYGIARQAGFAKISLQILTSPDTDGRLLGMIQTVAGYARERDKMDGQRIDAILETVKAAIANGTYLAISPQFIVTATM
jgi:ubiquinone/menaquinone biosynthesis C-methylase UbiE